MSRFPVSVRGANLWGGPATLVSFLLAVGAFLLTILAVLLTVGVFFCAYSGKVRLIRALRDCKPRLKMLSLRSRLPFTGVLQGPRPASAFLGDFGHLAPSAPKSAF